MNKQTDVTVATRQALIDAFWTLYAQKRIEKITIKEITILAQYNRGTFYEYFLDIYDLLSQEQNDIIKQLEEGIVLKYQSQSMDDILEQIKDFYVENGKRLNLLIGDGVNTEFVNRLKNTLYPIFQEKMEVSDIKYASIIYEYGLSGMIMGFHEWYRNYPDLPVDQFMKLLRSMIEKGIPHTIESALDSKRR